MVDIFEAGPVVACDLQRIRTVGESRTAKVAHITDDTVDGDEVSLVSNTQGEFRAACAALGQDDPSGVVLDKTTALGLGVGVGDTVRHVPLRPKEPQAQT